MAFMASTINHPLLTQITENLKNLAKLHVLEATGPEMFTKAVLKYKESNDNNLVKTYHHKYIYPFNYDHRDSPAPKKCREDNTQCATLFPEAFTVKFWGASWMKLY